MDLAYFIQHAVIPRFKILMDWLGFTEGIDSFIYPLIFLVGLLFDLVILGLFYVNYFTPSGSNAKEASTDSKYTWRQSFLFYVAVFRAICVIVLSCYCVLYITFPDSNGDSFVIQAVYMIYFSLFGVYLYMRQSFSQINKQFMFLSTLLIVTSDFPCALAVALKMHISILLLMVINMTAVVITYHCSISEQGRHHIDKLATTMIHYSGLKTEETLTSQQLKLKYIQTYYAFLVCSKGLLWVFSSMHSANYVLFTINNNTLLVLGGFAVVWIVVARNFLKYAILCYQQNVRTFAIPLEPFVLFQATVIPDIFWVLKATLRLNSIREYRQVLKNFTPVTPIVLLTHSMTIVSVSKCNKTHWTVFVIMRQWVIYLDNGLYVLGKQYSFFVVVRKVLRQGTRHLLRRAGHIRGFVKTLANPLVLKTAKHLSPLWTEEIQKYAPSLEVVVSHMAARPAEMLKTALAMSAAATGIGGVSLLAGIQEATARTGIMNECGVIDKVTEIADHPAIRSPESLAAAEQCNEQFNKAADNIKIPSVRNDARSEGLSSMTRVLMLTEKVIGTPEYAQGQGSLVRLDAVHKLLHKKFPAESIAKIAGIKE